MMKSDSPPPASSSTAVDNTEVSSQRTLPEQGEVPEAAKTVPKGDTSAGPQPNVIPETHTVPETEEQPSLPEGGAPTTHASFVNAEAPDTLMRALQGAIIVEEHRTLMGTVIENVQSVKSGPSEAYRSEERRVGKECRN